MSLTVTLQKGGMREFERTDIYPEYLLFKLPGTNRNWRVKIKEKPQAGILKSKGKPVYEYTFDGHLCKFRSVNKDGTFSKWMEPEIMNTIMLD